MLHVLQTPVNWVKLSKEQERLFPETVNAINHAKTALGARTAQAQKRGVPTVERLSFIQGRDQIMGSIESEEIDLVVKGSHGQYGLKEHVLGSNTYHVLRRSAVPVLVAVVTHGRSDLQQLFAPSVTENLVTYLQTPVLSIHVGLG